MYWLFLIPIILKKLKTNYGVLFPTGGFQGHGIPLLSTPQREGSQGSKNPKQGKIEILYYFKNKFFKYRFKNLLKILKNKLLIKFVFWG